MDSNFKNELLVSAASVGCKQEVTSKLIENFQFLIRKIVGYYLTIYENLGLDYDDLYNEGIKGLVFAMETYDVGRGSFASYAQTVIYREIGGLVKKINAPTHRLLTNAVSLDSQLYANNENYYLSDSVGECDCYMGHKKLPNSMIDHFPELICAKLDPDEAIVAVLLLRGYSSKEIAEKTKTSRRQTLAVIRAVKAKLNN
jgi:RNA polymerase sigma factor (sigma-70 family)